LNERVTPLACSECRGIGRKAKLRSTGVLRQNCANSAALQQIQSCIAAQHVSSLMLNPGKRHNGEIAMLYGSKV